MVTATLKKKPQPDVVDVEAQQVPGGPPAADEFDQAAGIAPAQQAPAEDNSEHRALVTTRSAPVERYSAVSDGALAGEFDETDLRHPALRLVNGSGKLSNAWQQGTLLFADEQLLPPPDLKAANPDHYFRFVPLRLEKSFRENLTDEQVKAGIMPRVAATIAEVESLGGTTQWIGDTKPSWSPTAKCLLLVEKPEKFDHPNFVIPIGDKLYAAGVFYASNSAYRHFAQLLFNSALTALLIPDLDENGVQKRSPKGHPLLKPYLPKMFWVWHTVKRVSDKFSTFGPEIKLDNGPDAVTGPEIREFIATILASESTPAGE